MTILISFLHLYLERQERQRKTKWIRENDKPHINKQRRKTTIEN